MKDKSSLQTVLASPMKDTFSPQLSLFWPKGGQNRISNFLYNSG
jgi:hypothetical protein